MHGMSIPCPRKISCILKKLPATKHGATHVMQCEILQERLPWQIALNP